tara:strand:+ start:774 stop:1214 length:441 start_codon:yes stop_codon:yes gene_type:complete
MKFHIYILLSVLFVSFSITQKDKAPAKDLPQSQKVDPIEKEWNDEIKKAKDPELKRLLEELRQDYLYERDILKKEYKTKLKNLKSDFSDRRKELIKKYRKENRKKKPKENSSKDKSNLPSVPPEKFKPLPDESNEKAEKKPEKSSK